MDKQSWQKNILEPVTQKRPERQETFATSTGLPIETVYTDDDATSQAQVQSKTYRSARWARYAAIPKDAQEFSAKIASIGDGQFIDARLAPSISTDLTFPTMWYSASDEAPAQLQGPTQQWVLQLCNSAKNSWHDQLVTAQQWSQSTHATIGVDPMAQRIAGNTCQQELQACADVLAAAAKAGVQSLSLHIVVGPNFIEELAKLRALQQLIEQSSLDVQVVAHTGFFGITNETDQANLIRIAFQNLAASLGHVDTICVHAPNSDDNAVTSAIDAIRGQLILLEESGVPEAIDPVAGAFAVESLASSMIGQISQTD